MTTPRVSVLLTTYNRERYVAAAIESVLAQTFEDFELLITDNQSVDRTVEIANRYAARDGRIRIVENYRNLGQFGNRNRAATLAHGALLKYHDSDDLMYPHCLAAMVAMLTAHPEAWFGLSSGACWPGGPCPMLLTPRMCYQREFLGAGLFMCGPSGAMFRREAFHALGGFEDIGAPSDYLFWLRACARAHVVLLPADLFWYRMHPAQEFQSGAATRQYATLGRYVWAALGADACPLEPDEREQARRNVMGKLVKATLVDLRWGRFDVARVRLAAAPPLADWLRYLRRPRRDQFVGTPLDPSGDFQTPDWHALQTDAARESRR